jgi:alkylation response protein AidB-like acyl-CoA dehydrogenase
MKLDLSEEQTILSDEFRKFFEAESSMARVRAAEPLGFDPELWSALGAMGALAMRLPGEDGFGLFEAGLVMEQAGRHLASAPLAEAIVAARLLAQLGGEDDLVARGSAGGAVLTIALHPAGTNAQIVPGAGVADAIVFRDGDSIRLAEQVEKPASPLNHGSNPLANVALSGRNAIPSRELTRGKEAVALFEAAVEEWKLLTALSLEAMGRRALEIAGDYAKERVQFGRQIGSFQAVAHPLADAIADIEGAAMLNRWAVTRIAQGADDAAAAVSMAFWWAAQGSSRAVATALHTHGGYGLTLEYDVQLYHRRAKAAALILGDPRDEIVTAGRRLWLGEKGGLPDAGEPGIHFDFGADAKALAEETRAFFEAQLTPEWHANSHYSYDGHDWGLNRRLGERRLLFPAWPEEHGGRGASDYAAIAALDVWDELDVTVHAQYVSNMVGRAIIEFGSDRLKADVLPSLSGGDIISCLGFSEPASGSDVFAAETRAVRDGDDWIVTGQKMFTSGANLAHHVLLLTRTDPSAPKHKGITMFIVPLDDPGVEIHPVHTFQDERTNATFYNDVRVPDAYRLGPVDGGLKVLTYALSLEQGGGGFAGPHMHVLKAAVTWARHADRGVGKAIEDPRVLERLAMAATRSRVSYLLFWRVLWLREQGIPDRAAGPMSKLFSSEAFLKDASDLFDLAAPGTLIRGDKTPLGRIELDSRHAAVTTIYGGTSEVHRSQVAEGAFGLPKSR